MKPQAVLLSASALLASVHGHGMLTKPLPRPAGTAFGSACGSQMLSQQSSDSYGNIQGEMQVISSGFDGGKCNLWLCKGYQFADNTNIQSFTPGETIAMTFDIRAPHTGVANVSIVDTATNTAIGSPLISWDVFASNAVPIQADQLNFEVTLPTDFGGKCTTAGECVIQHFWDARSIDQTYESCIDFTVSGSVSSQASVSSASSSAIATTAVASSVSASVAAPPYPANSTMALPSGTRTSTSTGLTTTAPVSVSASASTNIAMPSDSSAATSQDVSEVSTSATSTSSPLEASTNTFTTDLPLPSGQGQKYICYVDE